MIEKMEMIEIVLQSVLVSVACVFAAVFLFAGIFIAAAMIVNWRDRP